MQLTLPLGGADIHVQPPYAVLQPVLESYDHIIVGFSGGKDSQAVVLHLIEQGVQEKIELWHHDVDGKGPSFMDWPITPDYCRAFARAFDLPIYFSYREGGFLRELLKENDRTAPVVYETPDGQARAGGVNGKIATRRRFPQVTADLRTRWCSSTLKIDVMAAAIAGQDRFRGKRILVVTGERAEESASRARYSTFEPHRNHAPGPRARRHVDHWRPVHGWTETEVWEILERFKVRAHPCYYLGWSRASCFTCIFAREPLASVKQIAPKHFEHLASLEEEFGWTIHRDKSVRQLADEGKVFPMDPEIVSLALGESYTIPIIMDEWKLPPGAFGINSGPV